MGADRAHAKDRVETAIGRLDHCAGLVRAGDRDRFLAALFAPSAHRGHLHALYAFAIEIATVRARVSEPALGEIRLQWWREALESVFAGRPAGHPVADPLARAIEAGSLPRAPFEAMIDARAAELYQDQMPSLNDLEGYFGETESAVFQLAALILSDGRAVAAAEAVGHGGVAYGLARLLSDLVRAPWRVALLPGDMLDLHGGDAPPDVRRPSSALLSTLADLGHNARHHLEKARAATDRGDPALFSVFLPLATVAGDLARAARRPLTEGARLGNLARQWAIWRAAMRGRL